MTEEDLSRHLGFEIDDLFDVHELLRGKSFSIYQTLMLSRDEKGRCKITQPELMKRTGIKNRRTFYKHEEWLIKLRLLEKGIYPATIKALFTVFLKCLMSCPFRARCSNILQRVWKIQNKFR